MKYNKRHEMSKLSIRAQTKQVRLQSFREPEVQMWRMQTGLHAQAEPERISRGNSHARHSHVCRRQQLSLNCTDFESQSTKCCQLGEPVHSQTASRSDAK